MGSQSREGCGEQNQPLFKLKASTEASHPGPNSKGRAEPRPQPWQEDPAALASVSGDRSRCCHRTAELSRLHTKGQASCSHRGYIMHTHITRMCPRPHHTRARTCLRLRMTNIFNGYPKYFCKQLNRPRLKGCCQGLPPDRRQERGQVFESGEQRPAPCRPGEGCPLPDGLSDRV